MPRFAHRVAALCLAAACAHAADRDPWLKITSTNFELYTTGSERSGRDLIRHFEQVRSFFLQAFGSGLPDAKPARIIAFRDEKQYQPYRPNQFATAFFHPGESHDFIVMSTASSDHYPVATHEFTHLMVHQSGQKYPPWLNEGVAELFSNLQPVGNKIKVGQDIPGRMRTLLSDKWIPLSTVLAVDHGSPYYNQPSKAGMFYAESWELVHMLFLDPAYRPQLKALSAALKQDDPETALQKAYHKPVAAIEADLRSYLRGGTIKVMMFDVQLPQSVDTPQIETAAGLSARIALAELLSNYRGKTDQARAAYESLAGEYPKNWQVEEGWGQFSWRQRKIDDALRHYARAVELGGEDPRLYLEYGRVLYYTNRLAEAIDVLGKAARLNPESDEIRFELGSVYVRNQNFASALAELRAVKKVQPAQAFRYLYNRAFAEYRLGQIAEAREDAAQARTHTRNPEELASLDRLDRGLETSTARAAVFSAIEGTLENMECGTLARLHIRTGDGMRIFVMPGLRTATIRNAAGEPVDLPCGMQQPPHRVRIEYQALPGQSDAAGLVRSLEFK